MLWCVNWKPIDVFNELSAPFLKLFDTFRCFWWCAGLLVCLFVCSWLLKLMPISPNPVFLGYGGSLQAAVLWVSSAVDFSCTSPASAHHLECCDVKMETKNNVFNQLSISRFFLLWYLKMFLTCWYFLYLFCLLFSLSCCRYRRALLFLFCGTPVGVFERWYCEWLVRLIFFCTSPASPHHLECCDV